MRPLFVQRHIGFTLQRVNMENFVEEKRSLERKLNLSDETNEHKQQEYICQQCNQTFTEKRSLNRHVL